MFEIKELWRGGDHYVRHRIPGMIVTSKGTLIAYNEARIWVAIGRRWIFLCSAPRITEKHLANL